MTSAIILPLFIALFLAILCAFAGRQILHLFRVEIGGLNIYLRISVSLAVAELCAIFLLNIQFNYISYRSAGWLTLALLLILAAMQLVSQLQKPPSIKSWLTEMFPAVVLTFMIIPALFGIFHSSMDHIEFKYLFVSYIRNGGLPLIEKLPNNSWIIHSYHYGPELIVAILSPLAPSFDCINFVNLTKIPGTFHVAIYALMLYGVVSQLLPGLARLGKYAATFFVLYYGGNTALIYLAYNGLPPEAFINESLVPKTFLIGEWYNPLIHSLMSDSLIVAFRMWSTSLQHLIAIFLPVLWVLTVNTMAANIDSGSRRERVLLPSVLLIVMLAAGILIHEEVIAFVIGAGLFYLFFKASRPELRKSFLVWAVLVVISTCLFALLQGGVVSHLFYSHLAGGKTEIMPVGEGDLKGMVNNPPDRHIRFSPNPALVGYGMGRVSLIKHPWKMLIHHGIDYYILIPVTIFYLFRRMRRETADFSGVVDFWILMAVPMAFFSLFFRIAGQDWLCERLNKIELAALTIVMLFFWVREKAQSAWGIGNTLKYGIFYLAVALFFVSSTTRSIFYYITMPKLENTPIHEYCAERVNKFVNDAR